MRAPNLLRLVLHVVAFALCLTHGVDAGAASPSGGLPPSESVCPRTLFLETVTVRVFETSDMGEMALRAACIGASHRALATWRAQAQTSSQQSARACAAHMGAQGCLMGQAFTQPRCSDIVCPLTQKCTITLVRLGAPAPGR